MLRSNKWFHSAPVDRVHNGLKQLRGDRRGVTALEFAFVGPIFIAMILMVLGISLLLVAQENLDAATRDATRQIKIGSFTGSSYSQTLVARICSNIVFLPSCSSALSVYVSTAASGSPPGSGFSGLSGPTIQNGSFASSYGTLASDNDVLLAIGYNQNYVFPVIGHLTGSSTGMVLSTSVFQTEPY